MTAERRNINEQDSSLRHQLANAILERAKDRGLKDYEAAERLGIGKDIYSRLRTGQADRFSLSRLVEFADMIGIDIQLTTTAR